MDSVWLNWNNFGQIFKTQPLTMCGLWRVHQKAELKIPNCNLSFLVIDASFKIPPGLMEYNFAWIGDYEECLDIDSSLTGVKGKYCLISLSLDESKVKFSATPNHTVTITWFITTG